MFKNIFKPLLFLFFAYFIVNSEDAKMIIAGIAIFMLGMHFMEDGFKLFSGGVLEKILENSTNTLPKAIGTGFIATAIVQSSSLISVIVISFLSAEMLGLSQAIGIIFGSNVGTTTTAWIVAALGVNIKISAYAMPMIIFGVIFRFSDSNSYRGMGNILVGLGFIFLGIGYMKDGFDDLKSALDLSKYAMQGYAGILVYTIFGAVATIVIQSSSATMAIIITALATGQIIYVNALALAIGANIGTTVTAVLGALTSNENGKRLAVAHFIFNITTGIIAIIFIYQFADIVDYIASEVGIENDNYSMKLALFHTIFNIVGVIVVSSFIKIMVNYLERLFIPKIQDDAKPKYLDDIVIAMPESAIAALRKEVFHLYDLSLATIMHGMNLHRTDIFKLGNDLTKIVEESNKEIGESVDIIYKEKLKNLYSEILRYAALSQQNMNEDQNVEVFELKMVARKLIEAVKDMRELQKNINHYFKSKNQNMKTEYNFIRKEVASILKDIEQFKNSENREIDILATLESLKTRMHQLDFIKNGHIDKLIRENKIDAKMASSLINDSSFAYSISQNMIDIADMIWIKDEDIKILGVNNEVQKDT
jgi:phosphate:Na+ symporter